MVQWRLRNKQQEQKQPQGDHGEQQVVEQFTCVGSKCHIFPPKSGQVDLGLAWSSAGSRAEEVSCSLREAIQIIEEDSFTFAPRSLQSNQPKKKLLVKRLMDKLLSASNHMHQFQILFHDLRETAINIEEKLRATERAHMEALNQIEALSSEATARELHEEKDLKEKTLQQMQMVKGFGVELPEDNSASSGNRTGRMRTESTSRFENLKLKQEIQALVKDNQAKAAALDIAERNSTCALVQVEKHKEVIARTTADNMLFLMKLKQTEENLQAAKVKQEDLQKQLEFYRSSWLEEASSEIEDAVKGSLDKAQACEVELQKVRKQQESRMQEFEHKLQGLTNSLNCLAAVKQSLEQRLKTVEEERTNLLQRLEKEVGDRHHLEAESRALASTVDKNNREFSRLREQYEQLVEEMRVRSEEFNVRQEREAHLLQNLEAVNSQLETQRVMNTTLMKKKEEMEWICLEAQAEREKLKQQLRGLVNHANEC